MKWSVPLVGNVVLEVLLENKLLVECQDLQPARLGVVVGGSQAEPEIICCSFFTSASNLFLW